MLEPQTLSFGHSRAIATVMGQCRRYAETNYPILILGAPGTGKTELARYIHGLSGRPGLFVPESAAAVPEHIEVSHFAGHARGAFTGADRERVGLLESAHRGTFFLDELGDASPRVQQLLRQALDNRGVHRVGEVRSRPIDVRIIAATNANLKDMVRAGLFRQDLLDRFGFIKLEMPALAERRDEILPLVDYFLQQLTRQNGQPERPVLSDAVGGCLLAAPWRGNIRELKMLCQYMVIHADPGGVIEMRDLPPDFLAEMGDVLQVKYDRSVGAREALAQSGGNKTVAAKLLGVSRQHFYRLLEEAVMQG